MHLCSICGGSICQSMFVCQVLCTGIQGIYSPFMGGPSAKVCLSAKCCVLVFKASLLYCGGSICQSVFFCQVLCTGIQGIYAVLGGPSTKVGLSAKFGVAVFKASMLDSWWGPSAKVGSSAKYCVLVFEASLLYCGGSICQSRFICQVLCTGIQGISALLWGVHLPK